MSSCAGKFHLMIANIPKGMPVLNAFLLPNIILEWNAHQASHIQIPFEFANAYLHEDVCMLVFPFAVYKVKHDVMTFVFHKFEYLQDVDVEATDILFILTNFQT